MFTALIHQAVEDTIGDMSINLQAKLLGVLQQKTFQRVGGKETITADVRVITATHRDLHRISTPIKPSQNERAHRGLSP